VAGQRGRSTWPVLVWPAGFGGRLAFWVRRQFGGEDGRVPRRVAVALLTPPAWTPPAVDPAAWRLALAEDLLDVLATMTEVEAAAAAAMPDQALLSQVGWPGLPGYVVPSLTIPVVLTALAADGYEQAVLVAADAPDLPGMMIAKLLRPLTSRPAAVAPVTGGPGLVGLATRLPAPGWLPSAGLDDLTPQELRRLAPSVVDVAGTPGWHRLRGPADLARLDPGLEGWDATRRLLSA
jgi:hypothetical protein